MRKGMRKGSAMMMAAFLLLSVFPASVAEEEPVEAAPAAVITEEEIQAEAPAEETVPEAPAEEAPVSAEEPAPAPVEEAPAVEDTPVVVATPVTEVTPAPADEDEFWGEETDDGEIVELDDGPGYVDPELVAEYVPEVTDEMKDSSYIFGDGEETAGESQGITRAWIESENKEKIYFNEKATLVPKTEPATVTGKVVWEIRDDRWEEDVWETYKEDEKLELDVTDVTDALQYRFRMQDGTVSESFRMKAEERPAEEQTEVQTGEAAERPEAEGETAAEAPEGEIAAAEETGAADPAEGEAGEPAGDEAGEPGETAGEEPEEEIIEAEYAEEEVPDEVTEKIWITASDTEAQIGDTVVLTAEREPVLDVVCVWETRKAAEENWQRAGYGDTMTVAITEENEDSLYRVATSDGAVSDGIRLTAEKPRELPENRSVTVVLECEDEKPGFGSVIHFRAVLEGYDELDYTVQWVCSSDDVNWTEIEGATGETMDMVVTEENYGYFWRAVVTVNGFKTAE